MADIHTSFLRELLSAVGEQLRLRNERLSVLVVGGAALCLRGWVLRTTRDVDVLAVVDEQGWHKPDFSNTVNDIIHRVARDFGLEPGWLNAEVGAHWLTGVPPEFADDVEWVDFGGLQVGLPGRQLLITLKLFAAVDQGRSSVHAQDLISLGPSDQELEVARQWISRQDLNEQFPDEVIRMTDHVRAHR
jgi:hypothetical protein